MTAARIAELAEEAGDCIRINQLDCCEMEMYLRGFLAEVVAEALGKKKVTRARKR